MYDKLLDITNQLLDLGKRNRLLNFKDSGLKTLRLLNKNMEEIFRGITNNREFSVFNTDPILSKYHNELANNENDDELNYIDDKVYEICHPLMDNTEFLCYKKGYSLDKVLKSLSKEYKTSIAEKGINSLYLTFGYVHYVEEEIEYCAPLLLIPIELDNETGPYIVREYEDDVMVNPTLNHYFNSMFKVSFPEYKHDAIMTYFNKVKDILPEGTELKNGVAIGIYSFFKMNMYNDLMTNIDKVIENENIRVLLGEKDKRFDSDYKTVPIYPVVNYDSSQLQAIQNAADGKSFCLQGPPGSGKSQTITNIIASLLGNGKKILFVSEKIAALRVVFENLRRAGLSDFAIELHSNKTNKKEFIDNLYNTAVLPKFDIDFKTRMVGAQYNILSRDLEEYENIIHEIIPILGISLLDLYSEFLKIEVEIPNINIDFEDVNIHDFSLLCDYYNAYKLFTYKLGYDYRKHSLYIFKKNINQYAIYEFETELEATLRQVELLLKVEKQLNICSTGYIKNLLDATEGLYLIEKLIRIQTYNPVYLNAKTRLKLIDIINSYLSLEKELNTLALANYDQAIISQNIDSYISILKKNNTGIFKNKDFKDTFAKVLSYRIKKASYDDVIKELEELVKVKNKLFMANTLSNQIAKILGDIKNLNLRTVLSDLKVLDGCNDISMTKDQFNNIVSYFKPILSNFDNIKNDNYLLIKLSKNFDLSKFNVYKEPLELVHKNLIEIYDDRLFLPDFVKLSKIIANIKEINGIKYLDCYLDNNLDIEIITESYEKLFYKYLIDKIITGSKVLNEFNSEDKNITIKDFIDLDERKLTINRDSIIVLNSQKRPDEKVIEGSMFKILSHEHNKTRRHMPIRGLLEQIFELALDIKPVFLMSPLSVSTYLASKLNMFDCVIFDEASQIFASDALGSIYRAKQCIVIGDTKQMPPSNFFQAGADTFSEKEYDLESILDKATTSFNTYSLKWHYRSRNEELITFSNKLFYDSNLITIPQSRRHEQGFGIDFYYVADGRYDTKSRTNPIEAQRVCDMVFEHLKTSKESLGVVAFSNVQAELISDLIEKRLKKNPLEERYFPTDVDEPFFVKNLESVQGDERDRIIFSICYGYNNENKFAQRFGPLNNQGGERRLNVAITRAKFNVSIVSSIKYSDINTNNTESLGVKLLKNYLEFAENVTTTKNYDESDNGIFTSVKEYIETLGYDVYPNYGSSSFKIDLAVMKEEEFILAIMIDGNSSYTDSLTDKYRLERLLLERQGWRYLKLYSTAWFNDKEAEIARINDVLMGEYEPQGEFKHNDVTYLKEDKSDNSFDSEFNEYLELDMELGQHYYETKGMSALVNALIKREQPIHQEYLYKRIAQILEKPRMEKKFKDEIDSSISVLINKINDFYFMDPNLRVRLRYNSKRDLAYIHPLEIYDGIYTIVSKNSFITVDGCYKTVAQFLGFDKVIPNLRKLLDENAEILINEHKISRKNDGFIPE